MKIILYYIKDYLIREKIYDPYNNNIMENIEKIINKEILTFVLNEIPSSIKQYYNINDRIIDNFPYDYYDVMYEDNIMERMDSFKIMNNIGDFEYLFEIMRKIDVLHKSYNTAYYVSNLNKVQVSSNLSKENYYIRIKETLYRIKNYNKAYNLNKYYNVNKISSQYDISFLDLKEKYIKEEDLINRFLECEKNFGEIGFITLFNDFKNNEKFYKKYKYIDNSVLILLSDEQRNEIIKNDVEFFINNILKDKRQKMIFNNRFGINEYSKKTLQQCGDILSITRERVRQSEEKIISFYIIYSSIDLNFYGELLKNKIYNQGINVNLDKLKEIIKDDVYFFISSVTNYKDIKKDLFISVPISIFDDYYMLNKEPYNEESLYEIISEKTNIDDNLISLSIRNLIEENKIIKKEDGYYINKSLLKKISIFTNYLMDKSEGVSMEEAQKEVKEKFGVSLNLRLFTNRHDATFYLYGKKKYRHRKFLYDEHDFNEIKLIINLIIEYFNGNKNKKVKLKEIKEYIKLVYKDINYYNLRIIIDLYGLNDNIFFDGKSSHDVVSLNPLIRGNLELKLIESINKQQGLFTINDITENHNFYSFFSLNSMIAKLCNTEHLFKVDGNNYLNKRVFMNNYVLPIENKFINEINNIKLMFDEESKISLRYLLSLLNTKLKKNYHKNFVINLLRIYKSSFADGLNISDYNLIYFKDGTQKDSIKSIFDLCYDNINDINLDNNKKIELVKEELLKKKVFYLDEEFNSFFGYKFYNENKGT